jgi:hypothetical protein
VDPELQRCHINCTKCHSGSKSGLFPKERGFATSQLFDRTKRLFGNVYDQRKAHQTLGLIFSRVV